MCQATSLRQRRDWPVPGNLGDQVSLQFCAAMLDWRWSQSAFALALRARHHRGAGRSGFLLPTFRREGGMDGQTPHPPCAHEQASGAGAHWRVNLERQRLHFRAVALLAAVSVSVSSFRRLGHSGLRVALATTETATRLRTAAAASRGPSGQERSDRRARVRGRPSAPPLLP